MIGLAIGLGLALLGQDAPAPFNLECSGTFTTMRLSGETSESYRAIYRIDLSRMKWCEGECRSLHDVFAAGPGQVTLTSKKTDTVSENSSETNTVDRVTGAHLLLAMAKNPRSGTPRYLMKWEGKCAKAAFTGFTVPNTKF